MNNGFFKRLNLSYIEEGDLIRARLKEFRDILEGGDDKRIFEELAFCILTAGASAKMGIRSIDAIRDILFDAGATELRNIGFCGYGILDKHILRCLYELRLIKSSRPPTTRKRYLRIENRLRKLATALRIDFDELDLLLWTERPGEILK